mmetsp:Transcript_6297/g.15076  ORF Transcript_6297/g.15076 Transcript_6297/m.15076 type:complete len:92 (-) Transcript_6297:2190-2465(-)
MYKHGSGVMRFTFTQMTEDGYLCPWIFAGGGQSHICTILPRSHISLFHTFKEKVSVVGLQQLQSLLNQKALHQPLPWSSVHSGPAHLGHVT